jgi:hypothetical protein
MALSAPAAFAATEAQSVTYTVDSINGTFTSGNGSGTYFSTWKSKATSPQLTVSSGTNNFSPFDSEGRLVYNSGSGGSSTITLSAGDGWYVSAYTFSAALVDTTASITYSANGAAAVSITKTPQTISATVDQNTTASIAVAGSNSGVTLSNFSVTLTERPVPEFYTTTIVDGRFADETPWYTMQIASTGFYLKSENPGDTIQLNSVDVSLADSELWCFVGTPTEGYRLYNKAIGPGKALAAPTTVDSAGNSGGNSCATVQAEDQDGYVYDWIPSYSSSISGVEGVYLAAKGHSTWRLNNRNYKLSFWTGGADAGSTLQFVLGKFTAVVAPSKGTFDRDNTWVKTWTRTAEPTVTFGTSYNNMTVTTDSVVGIATGQSNAAWTFTCPEGMHISGYEFDYAGTSTSSWNVTNVLTLGNSTPINVTADALSGHASISGLTADSISSLTYTGSNGYVLALSNFKVTVERDIPVHIGTIVFRYDGTPAYNVAYRIPAITTILEGKNKGRVLAINDYRYCGGDIGNGRIDLYQSYSTDQGLTWSAPDHMRDSVGTPVAQGTGVGTFDTSLENPDCGFGDAAIVSDCETGRVLVMSVCGHTTFWAARRNNPNQLARWYSEDGGDTWSSYETITDSIYSLFDGTCPNGYVDSMFFGSGKICQSRKVKVGSSYRLYAVMVGYNAEAGTTSNWVLYSDDFGLNWAILGDPKQPAVATSADEPKAEELPDGSVLLSARRNGGNRHFNIFRYSDVSSGSGTWDDAVATNCGIGTTINGCNGEILILPAVKSSTQQPCYVALQSIPYSSSRTQVSILWKEISSGSDMLTPSCFTSWDGHFQVSSIGSAYSTMTLQTDHSIGFLYEEETYGKSYCEVYRNLSLEDITSGAYTYCEDTDTVKANAIRSEVVNLLSEQYNESKYVGQPTEASIQRLQEGVSAYTANPDATTYQTFNSAVAAIASDEVITIQQNALYRLMSAHDGTYASITADRYLTSDGTNLVTTEATDSTTYFALMQREGSDNWILYHPATSTFVAVSPSTSSKFTVTDDADDADEYAVVSAITGKSNLTSTNPTTAAYASLHMDSSTRVVAWGSAAAASQWYIELMDTDAVDLPDIETAAATTSLTSVSSEQPASERSYYDLLGRRVAAPKPGELYITSDGRKLLF